MRLTAPLDVLVINMDRDVERLRAITAEFAALEGFALRRHPGFLATLLPLGAVRRLARDARQVGALGVFLAHLGAWERIAEGTRPALVLEDDVTPVNPRRLLDAELPDDADIVFCNSRMDPGRAEGGQPGSWKLPVGARPVDLMVPLKAERRGPPGGDGYLLTAEGARKLVAACAEDGYGGHVDWRLLRYCLRREAIEAVVAGTWLAGHGPLGNHPARWDVLKGYCLEPAVIRHHGHGESSRAPLDGVSRAARPPPPADRVARRAARLARLAARRGEGG